MENKKVITVTKNIDKNKILLITLALFYFISTISSAVMSSTSSMVAPTNMIVDFDLTSLDSSLGRGDSGIMNLVIKNTGDYRAEDVEVWLPSTGSIHLDKRFYVGRMEAGGSKTIPVIFRVDNQAKTGLNAIQVRIIYDGFDSDGKRENNQLTNWEIPIIVYGDPLFQITPSKTTYFKDNLDELILEGLTMDSVRDLEARVSSNCATIIGSSKEYVGDLDSGQKFNITYDIKPSSSGACVVSLSLVYTDESGSKVSDDLSIGLNVEEAGVDFKVVNIGYNPTGPGETTTVKISLKNVGQADSKDTTLVLSLTDPFAPVDTSEKYLGTVAGGKTIDTEFNIAIGWDAEIKTYPIPLTINYKVGGTSYSVKKDIGVDVSGKVILEVINVEASSRGTITVEVANIGTRTADGVKATLTFGNDVSETQQQIPSQIPSERGGRVSGNITRTGNFSRTSNMTQSLVSYKSDIKPNKQTTFTFQGQGSGQALLTLEYTGLNNQRVTQTERITLGSGGAVAGVGTSNLGSTGGGTSIITYVIYAIIILVLVWIVYRKYKRKNMLPDFLAKKTGQIQKI